MMKKKGFLLLLAAGLLVTGCGKDDEEKKEEKKEAKVSVLTCTQEEGDEKLEVTIEQDKKTYKFNKATMTMTVDKSMYEDFAKEEDALKSLICDGVKEEGEAVKDCKVSISGNNITTVIEYDPDSFVKDFLDDNDKETEFNADTLKTMKESAEKEGASCKLS